MTRIDSRRHLDWPLALLGLGLSGYLLLAVPASSSQRAMTGPLDGKTFSGEAGYAGKDGHPDAFVFTAGTFRSTGCDPYGFTAAPYEAMGDGDAIRFKAVTKSPTDGTITWMGKAAGDRIEGTAVWRPMGKKPVEMWFRATLENSSAVSD